MILMVTKPFFAAMADLHLKYPKIPKTMVNLQATKGIHGDEGD